jgi:menaquinone-dependent protoporphyrinogen oxidase
VVIGGAIYMWRWHRDARRFLHRHRRVLSTMPVAMFGIGPTTIDDKSVASSLEQLERALARVPEVAPVSVVIFGGVIDPARLHFPFSGMAPSDARDWDDITAWAGEVAGHVSPPRYASPGSCDGSSKSPQVGPVSDPAAVQTAPTAAVMAP